MPTGAYYKEVGLADVAAVAHTGIRYHECPKCGSYGLVRTHTRLVDRLLRVVTPLYRVRCSNILCGYEGNLRMGTMTETARSFAPIVREELAR